MSSSENFLQAKKLDSPSMIPHVPPENCPNFSPKTGVIIWNQPKQCTCYKGNPWKSLKNLEMRQAKAERKTVEINVAKESLQMLPLMEEILHQLIGSYPIIYRALYIPGGAGFLPSTVLQEIRYFFLEVLCWGVLLRDLFFLGETKSRIWWNREIYFTKPNKTPQQKIDIGTFTDSWTDFWSNCHDETPRWNTPTLPSLKLTVRPENKPCPKRKSHLPTINFQERKW